VKRLRRWLEMYLKKFEKPDYANSYDFYKCGKCDRILTHLQMQARLHTGRVCACGALKYSPTYPKPLQWLLPNILTLVVYRILRCA